MIDPGCPTPNISTKQRDFVWPYDLGEKEDDRNFHEDNDAIKWIDSKKFAQRITFAQRDRPREQRFRGKEEEDGERKFGGCFFHDYYELRSVKNCGFTIDIVLVSCLSGMLKSKGIDFEGRLLDRLWRGILRPQTLIGSSGVIRRSSDRAYALISKGVRLVCTNVTGRSAKTVVLRTQGNGSIKDNIVTVFGTKTLACLEPLDFCVSDGIRIEGFLSKPGSGSGRASGDRQFFYVNGRPVDMPKVSKLLNELYKSYNSQQYPMAILNFILPTTAYDVNVTPDKRKIFLHDEGPIISGLRESLEKVYAPNQYTYAMNNFESDSQLGQGCFSLLSSQNMEGQEPSPGEDCEVITNVQNKGALLTEENKPNAYYEELLQDCIEEAMHEEMDTRTEKADDAFTETDCNRSDPKARTSFLVDFTPFQCGSSGSKFAPIAKQVKPPPMQSAKGVGKESKKASHLNVVQSKLTGYVTQNKRQLEEGTLLSEEPVLKKGMFCAEEKTNSGKGNFEVPRLGICSQRELGSTSNLILRNEDQCDTQAMVVSRKKIIPSIENCEQLPDEQGHMQIEDNQDAGVEVVTSKTLETMFSADIEDTTVNPLCLSDAEMEMKTDEANIYNVVESNVSDAHLDNKDIQVIQFDINKCRLKRSKGLLNCNVNAGSWKRAKGQKKRSYAAATLAKSSVIEDGAEKEEALAAATRELEKSFNKEDFTRMKGNGSLKFLTHCVLQAAYAHDMASLICQDSIIENSCPCD
eukprot:Gb_20030 [translate_table: standard]